MGQLVAPIRKSWPITIGSPAPEGRELAANCTVAGACVVHFAGDPAGQNHTMALSVGYSVFPYAVDLVVSSAATATFTNLGVLGG